MARHQCPSSQHSVTSTDGAFIATIHASRLIIRSATTTEILQRYQLPQGFSTRCKVLQWSRKCGTRTPGLGREERGLEVPSSHCVLLADEETVRVFDIEDPAWQATINGAANNLGKIASVAFGHSYNEVLVFSDFGVKVTIWSLITSRGVEIRDPKYSAACYNYRPQTGHLALLTRPGAQDTMMILKPGSHEVIRSLELPTADAQEVQWSVDGRWIAIRDTASSGYKVCIYTADGHLFRTFTGSQATGSDIALGVKRLQWSPSSGCLAVGDYNDNVTLLNNSTFSHIATFRHTNSINLPQTAVWEEEINASNERSYIVSNQPASPPTSASIAKSASPRYGVSVMAFNINGSLLATKSDSIPSTVWIWSLQTGRAVAILIHHSPVKHVAWHPTTSDLLLIECALPEPAIHLWGSSWETPRAVILPLDRASGRLEASWVQCADENNFNLMISSANQYTTTKITDTGDIIPAVPAFDGVRSIGTGPEDMFDEGNSLDLSPIKISHPTTEFSNDLRTPNDYRGSIFGMTEEGIDDTFHYRKNLQPVG